MNSPLTPDERDFNNACQLKTLFASLDCRMYLVCKSRKCWPNNAYNWGSLESFCRVPLESFCLVHSRAVVRGGTGGTLAPPEFRVSEKRTKREIDSLLLLALPDLKIKRQL